MESVDNTNFIKEINEKQIQIFQKFQETLVVESQTVFSATMAEDKKKFYLNQNEVIRILIAREFDPKKSLVMWKNWVKWREENNPTEIKENEIELELKSGKGFLSGYDLQNNPIFIGVLRRHLPGTVDKQITVKMFIYYLEESLRRARNTGTGRVTILADMTGYTKKNFSTKDSDLIKTILAILQDNYPESLAKLIIYKPNWLFKLVFAIVKPFLSKRTSSKIIVVKKEEDLKKIIGEDQLLKEYGGKSPFQYAYPIGSKPINAIEGKIEEVEAPENGEDPNVDQNIIE